MKKIYLLLLSALIFTACKKKHNAPEPVANTTVNIILKNTVGGIDLVLGDTKYTSSLGHSFDVQIFKYFLSNFEFIREDGTLFTVPQDDSYFLINQSVASSLTLPFTIPTGTYKAVRFMVGVDSLRNTKGIDERKGALDPTEAASGMYWTWNSGYIHFMLEGSSNDIPERLSSSHHFKYHIGGFGGYSSPTPNNTRIVEMDLSTQGVLIAKPEKVSSVLIDADINKFFNTNNIIDFTFSPLIMTDFEGVRLAENVKNIFEHNQTINE